MTVAELKGILSNYPDDCIVKVTRTDSGGELIFYDFITKWEDCTDYRVNENNFIKTVLFTTEGY